MKYIRTYETEEKFLTDKDSTSRGFRLKPTLYKYSEAGDHIHLEIDDPRKHGDSTWIRLEFTEATEFSFKISNVTGDDSNTLNYTIDWSDGTVETNTAVQGTDGLYTFTHSYAIGTYNMELYGTDRDYIFVGIAKIKQNAIGSYFSAPGAIKRVIVGDRAEVGELAFGYCSSLTSVNLPSTLTSIGPGAFMYCSSLTSVNIPEGVTSIGDMAFAICESLTSVNILASTPPTLGSTVFDQSILINVPRDNFTNYASSDWMYYLRYSITGFEHNDILYYLTENNTAIVYGYNQDNPISSVDIPSSIQYDSTTYNVTSIGSGAFENCSSLTSINIPEGVTSIGSGAFVGCSSLTSINIPERVTSIGSMVFNACSSLTSITIPEGVTSIGNWVFSGCTSLTSINIPERVTSIGSMVFVGCSSLTSINIPEGVTSIGMGAFGGCNKLASISSYNSTAPTFGNYDSVFYVPTNGTLHVKPGATGYDAWLSQLPSGWTIVEDL